MIKLESRQDIKHTAVNLHKTLLGSDIESIRMAEESCHESCHQLVDRFYKENEDMRLTEEKGQGGATHIKLKGMS